MARQRFQRRCTTLAVLVAAGGAASAGRAPSVLAAPPPLTGAEAVGYVRQVVKADLYETIGRRAVRCARRGAFRQVCALRWKSWIYAFAGRATITRSGLDTSPIDRYQLVVTQRTDGSRPRRKVRSGRIVIDTRRAAFGQPLQLLGNEEVDVIVTPTRLIDPYASATYSDGTPIDTPSPGTRFLAIELSARNVARGAYEDSFTNGARLVTTANRTIDTTYAAGCNGSGIKIPAGETRVGCVVFEVPFGVAIRQFEFATNSGYGEETGAWAMP